MFLRKFVSKITGCCQVSGQKKFAPVSFFISFYFSVGLFYFFSFAVKLNILERKRNEQRRGKLMGLMVKRLPRTNSFIEARNLSVSLQQVKMVINILRHPVYF